MNFNKLYKYLYMVILIFLGIYLINSSNNSNYNDDKKQTSAQRYENTEKYNTPNPTQEDKDILEQNVNLIRKNPFSINPIPIEEVLKNPTKYLNKEVVFGLVTVIDNNLNDKTLYVSNINIQDNCKGKRTSFIGSEILLNYKNLKKTNIAPNDIKGMSYYVLYVKGRVLLLDKNKPIIELSDIHATGKYQTDDSNIYIPIE